MSLFQNLKFRTGSIILSIALLLKKKLELGQGFFWLEDLVWIREGAGNNGIVETT
jgi:hypothetical protein